MATQATDRAKGAERRSRTPKSAYLLARAGGAGVVDAASYLGLGRVFTANMTGNTVLLGVALARGSGADAARSATALGVGPAQHWLIAIAGIAMGAQSAAVRGSDVRGGLGALGGAFAEKAWHAGVIAIPLTIVCAVAGLALLEPARER